MTVSHVIDVYEMYKRFSEGKKVREDSWDYITIPNSASAMKEKYKISFGKKILPEDLDMCERLFYAGLDMLVSTGYYSTSFGRVMKITEDEVLDGIRRAPKKMILGSSNEAVECIQRHGNGHRIPVIQSGPTGAPVSEDIFPKLIQSYAQGPVVDTIVSGVMDSFHGHVPTVNSPWEIRATAAEIMNVREACSVCGRPGMGI